MYFNLILRLLCVEVESLMAYSKPNGISLINTECHSIPIWLNVTTSDSMFAIDVEVLTNRTYWIDNNEKVLKFSCKFFSLYCMYLFYVFRKFTEPVM